MKSTHRFLLNFAAVVAIAASAVSLTSCDDYDGYYYDPVPPYGWNTNFWDSRLTGCWQLISYNGTSITQEDTNYLLFNGSGHGTYYYYMNGTRFTEGTKYYCQRAVSGATRYQMNIIYETAGASWTTVDYWFPDRDTLVMQWRNQTGLQSYTYRYYGPQGPWR